MKFTNTKRTLFASIISLVLCLSMLVGSTFAWFTDTASTGVNTINAGNLDLVLEYWNGAEWKEVTESTLLFDENALWEPGHTEVAYLKISNAGTLAFKYQFNINVANEIIGYTESNEPIKLSEFLKYGTVEGKAFVPFANREAAVSVATKNLASYTKLGKLEKQGDFDYIAIAVTMPTTVGNEANYRGATPPSIQLGVNVLAAQTTFEFDSFDNQYDKDAEYDAFGIRSHAELTEAIAAGKTELVIESGTYASSYSIPDNANLLIKDGTFTGENQRIFSIRKANTSYVINDGSYKCTVLFWTDVNATAVINGGNFNLYAITNNEGGIVNVEINGGTFKIGAGGFAAGTTPSFTINGGTFNVDPTAYVPAGINVVNNGDGTWTVGGGSAVVPPQESNIVEIATAEELRAFADNVNNNGNTYAGKTVKLTADIDLGGELWTPIGQTGATEFKGVFDGNGHTIYGLYVNNTDASGSCSSGLFGWIESHGSEGVTVKNLTIDGANVNGHHYVGVIVGYVYGTIENCHVKNSTINCTSVNDDANGDKCGLIAGYVGEDAEIKGCTGANSLVNAGRDAGQIVGAAKPACVTDCSATDVAVKANGTSTGANINEAVIGRAL